MTAGRINPWLWLGLPVLACAAAQIVLATPIRVLGLSPPEPLFALVPAFAWGVAGTSVIAPFALAGLGIFLDALLGAPAGLWPFSLTAAYAAAFFGRPLIAGQGMTAHLAWWMGVCVVAFAAAFAFCGLASGLAPNLVAVIWQLAATTALFPIAWRLTQRYEDADVRFR